METIRKYIKTALAFAFGIGVAIKPFMDFLGDVLQLDWLK